MVNGRAAVSGKFKKHNRPFIPTIMSPKKFLFVFAQAHHEFRIPEIESISELNRFQVGVPEDQDSLRPFMIFELESEDHARLLAQRCILIK